jgi:hypothetical protein
MRVAPVLVLMATALLVLSGCSGTERNAVTTTPTAESTVVSVPPSSSSSPAQVPPSSVPASSVPASSVPPSRVPASPAAVTSAQPAVPTVDPLTGGPPNSLPVIAVKIDNTYFGVRQFGVADADVVFVEQVEGGLTRLIAVFHSTLPDEVGPVRSVRSTDAQLLPVFGRPALVFAGGAGGPMAALRATRIVDTSALTGAYFRSPLASGTYNLHADLKKIAAGPTGLQPAKYLGLHFATTSPLIAAGRRVSTIHLVMQAADVDFTYRSHRFVRTRHGGDVLDHQGKPQQADNVLVQHVVDEPDGTVDSVGSPSYLSKTVGSGTVTLFRDGAAIPGTWKRAAPTDPFVYSDATGHPLPFKPGKTWIALAPQSAQLTLG